MFRFRWTLVFLVFATSRYEAKTINQPKIVIVGAGLSGISAAVKLIENGFENVMIFEAENRIGGRIYSVPFANGMIDLGAQWVHGETNNVVYDLMRDHFPFGDTGVEHTEPLFMTFGGKPVNQEQCKHLLKMSEEILEDYEEMKKFNGTLGDFVTQKYWKKVQFDQFTPKDLPAQMIDLMQKEVNVWNGTTSWFDISAKLNANSDVNTGNQYLTWLDKGYSTVLDYLVVS
jgi:spermine oxidase